MPRIPIIKTKFPNQMWEVTPKQNYFFFDSNVPGDGMRINPVTARTRAASRAALNRMFNNNLSRVAPVYGPELPYELERQRIAMKNAEAAYNEALEEERARQAYNRKVAAWNSYKELPYRERQWIANDTDIKSYLGPEMWGYDEKELDRIKTLDELENYLREMHPEDNWPRPYPMQELPVYESFDEFPDELSDAPWRRW